MSKHEPKTGAEPGKTTKLGSKSQKRSAQQKSPGKPGAIPTTKSTKRSKDSVAVAFGCTPFEDAYRELPTSNLAQSNHFLTGFMM